MVQIYLELTIMPRMKPLYRVSRLAAMAFAFLHFLSSSAFAQLSEPNADGVAMGHLHYHVRDVEANKRFWVTLGGEVTADRDLGGDQTSRSICFPDSG